MVHRSGSDRSAEAQEKYDEIYTEVRKTNDKAAVPEFASQKAINMSLQVFGGEPEAILTDFLYQLKEKEFAFKIDPEEPYSVIVAVPPREDVLNTEEETAVATSA